MGDYIEQEQLEDLLSVAVVRRILDDNNDGAPDAGPLAQVIAAAEVWFESVAINVYPDRTALRRDGGPQASQMVLDCAFAICAKRFPRAMPQHDWTKLWEMADKQLMRLRKGEIRLPVVGSPNPPANVGGAVFVGDNATTAVDEPTYFAIGGTGLF